MRIYKNVKLQINIIILVLFLFLPKIALANSLPDFDHDGVPDRDEIEIYKTDYKSADTDSDGYSDWVELNAGFSPLNPGKIKLEDSDYDHDGLSDRMELNFGTDLSLVDSDGDGFSDGEEIDSGYDPLNADIGKKLEKRIEINTGAQELSYFLGGVRMGKFIVSSGKPSMPTPRGHFKVKNKSPKAWSAAYGLWMPYWIGLGTGSFGIHELPVWPSGYREGEDHLGTPVSHGCIRLGIGPAEVLYNWAEAGIGVFIY